MTVAEELSIDEVIKQINKDFGKGTVQFLGDQPTVCEVGVISTGSLALDVALGVGGIPRGRITEVYGTESSAKTTLCYHIVSQAQKMGLRCAFIDVECSVDRVYAAAIGVDVDSLLISQPSCGEEGLQVMERLALSGTVGLIVLDSVAALTPRAEVEGEYGDAFIGLQARMMGQAMRKLAPVLSKNGVTAVFTNQVRENVGGYGNPIVTPGGRALKFYSSVRIETARIKKGETNSGMHINCRCRVTKNKVAPPFREAEFLVGHGIGIIREGAIVDVGEFVKIVERAGGYYTLLGTQYKGRQAVFDFLRTNPETMDELENKIRALAITGEVCSS